MTPRDPRHRARLLLWRIEGDRQLIERLVMGTQVKNPPYGLVADAPLATQRGEEASVDDRRFAAARPADDRNDVGRRAPLDLLDQLVDEALAAEEQARVLLAERQGVRPARSFSAAAASIAAPCAPEIRRCRDSGSSRPERRSTQVLRLRKLPIGMALLASPGRSTGMNREGLARVCGRRLPIEPELDLAAFRADERGER